MTHELHHALSAGKQITRNDLLHLLQAALDAGEPRFVRSLAQDWLQSYPHDLFIEFIAAQAYVKEAKPEKALAGLIHLVEVDPEFIQVQELLASMARRLKPELAEEARATVMVLRGLAEAPADIQPWAQGLIGAQQALVTGDLQAAEKHIQGVLLNQPPSPLPALLHLKIAEAQQLSWQARHNLVELYRERWPSCLQFRLLAAANRMESGLGDEAIDLLHGCAAEDISGQVPARLWGAAHRFTAIWPDQLSHPIGVAVPAAVAAALHWNQLPAGNGHLAAAKTGGPASQQPVQTSAELPKLRRPKVQRVPPKQAANTYVDELGVEYALPEEQEAKSVQTEMPVELEDITTKAEDLLLRADGRRPAYVVLTSQQALQEQYGPEGLAKVDQALKAVVAATEALPYWTSHLVYADRGDSLQAFGLQAVDANDPWAIKHLLADLDEALRQKGEMVGAVLIVGGPQIIPFHRLPNPVDDEDADVPSDNPYASLDENYFVPTWPLGRLPNGEGRDPAMLVKKLNQIVVVRGQAPSPAARVQGMVSRLLAFFGLWRPKRSSFGYSAEIWQRASHSVYRTISDPSQLSISPPTGTGQLPKEANKPLQLAYFNLHGLAETAEWYGQRDPFSTPSGPDYPVALRPSDVINSGRAPQVVFSEACFGAHIYDKTVENALSLKFLDSGSKAVIGSTVTSYGSVTTPLIAADLLGQAFWKLLNEGHPVGEALRRAKIAMAQTMHRRQGYLDGEDQKTLISFVLYGDPLAHVTTEGETPKRILRVEDQASELKAICDLSESEAVPMERLPENTLATIKSVVADYLPGMQDSRVSLSHEHTDCRGHDCTLPHLHSKSTGLMPTRSLVTLSKKIPAGNLVHHQYARITMDAQGKVVKMAVSR
ncbi:MAG: hypothetical protein KIS80_07755 [Anaerolineales bacterium]|nr:hypothetical protein [Anaerolineales bacterium]